MHLLDDAPSIVYQLWYDMMLASDATDEEWGWKKVSETAKQARDRIKEERERYKAEVSARASNSR